MIQINRFPHFVSVSMHADTIKDQSLFLPSSRYLPNHCTKKHNFSNRKQQQLVTTEFAFYVLH